MRLPYLLEEKLGLDMQHAIACATPNTLLQTPLRHAVKGADVPLVKAMIFRGEAQLDDPLDVWTCHTLLHDAVILNRQELFDFLLRFNC